MLMNGSADPLVQWQGGMIRGERGMTMPVEAMINWWLDVNGVGAGNAATEALPDPDSKDECRVTRTVWPAGDAGSARVVFYRVEGGGHSLPSIARPRNPGILLRRLIGPECHSAEGAELAWEFFATVAGETGP